MIDIVTLDLYERWLDRSPPPSVALPPGLELVIRDSPAALDEGPLEHAEATARVCAGQACAVVRRTGQVIASCWLTTAPAWVGEIHRVVVPGPGDAYLYDAHTASEWRGRGLFRVVLAALLRVARDRGVRRALIFALAANRASGRAIERAGFERFQRVTRLEVCGVGGLWYRGPRSARGRVPAMRRGARGAAVSRRVSPPHTPP